MKFDARGEVAISLDGRDVKGITDHAVLIHTGHSERFDTDRYHQNAPHLTPAAAEALVNAGVSCVGIDSINVDSMADLARPVHSILLGSGVPIVEHLTSLSRVPASGFTFTAVPPPIVGAGTFPVRAFATLGGAGE